MPISFTKGRLFEAQVEAIVHPVNTVGVMSRSMVLFFKKRFPVGYSLYIKACRKGNMTLGKVYATYTTCMDFPKYLVHFPVQSDWREAPQLASIENGLDDLITIIQTKNIQSVAIPALGCGMGGLDWATEVKPLIVRKMETLAASVKVIIFEPHIREKV